MIRFHVFAVKKIQGVLDDPPPHKFDVQSHFKCIMSAMPAISLDRYDFQTFFQGVTIFRFSADPGAKVLEAIFSSKVQ